MMLVQPSTWCITLLVSVDLGDPRAFGNAFAEHHRKVYTAAFGVLNDAAMAQDVVQDVFLRLWRRPGAFDPQRGDLGAYLRLMGRSRALDLWRTAQAGGPATGPPQNLARPAEARPPGDTAPAARRGEEGP